MTDPYMGEIRMVGFTYAPSGWMFCQGQQLPISQYSALFALLGTQYGGNGVTTFGLPDFRGRVPMSFGQGPGLTPRVQGEVSGTESVTLITTQMPMHNHLLAASKEDADQKNPTQQVLGTTTNPTYIAGPLDTTMNPQSIGPAGGSQPHPNMQPYLVVNFIIAIYGIFPPRN